MDYTGTGNTLNARNPRTLQLIMDSLRYWILEMRVDGFRFDLASRALARELHDVDRLGRFSTSSARTGDLGVKLIAEPGTWARAATRGQLPPLWSEWNGKYRDTVRDTARRAQHEGRVRVPFTGSSDLYEATGRRPFATSLRDRARRLHPRRPRLLQREEKRGNGEKAATARATTVMELASRGRRTIPRSPRSGPAEAELPGYPDAVPGRAHAARG